MQLGIEKCFLYYSIYRLVTNQRNVLCWHDKQLNVFTAKTLIKHYYLCKDGKKVKYIIYDRFIKCYDFSVKSIEKGFVSMEASTKVEVLHLQDVYKCVKSLRNRKKAHT